jgi:hypothetical protein
MVVLDYSNERLEYNDGLVTHNVHYKEPKRKDLYLPCTCETELLRVSKWEDEEEIYFSVYSFFAEKYSFWERLGFLFKGKTKTCELIMNKKEFDKLRNF